MAKITNQGLTPEFVSVIIPVKNEGKNIAQLAKEVQTVMHGTSWSWECLWVDDGSTDHTLSELQQINKKDARHQFVVLGRNYGQSAALHVGFRYAQGEILATLDGDGQNDPNDIPLLVRRLLEDGADMVNGVRQRRRDTFVRKMSSRIANGFRNWVTKEHVHCMMWAAPCGCFATDVLKISLYLKACTAFCLHWCESLDILVSLKCR